MLKMFSLSMSISDFPFGGGVIPFLFLLPWKLGTSHSSWSYETALVGAQAIKAVYLCPIVGSRGSGLPL